MKTALSIAGSDSCAGAGIQADLKTMAMNGVYATTAITALTAQNTTGVAAVLEVQPDGRLVDTRTCIANAHAFKGKTIITIEGQAKTDSEGNVTELTPIQKAFIEKFSFQCGYCTPGFVAGATAFIDRLKHEPVKRADLESAIEDALNDHICRCTGYVRYYEAVRDVALATPGCVIGSVD